MTSSSVYLEAAKTVHQGDDLFSCVAAHVSAGEYMASHKYSELFRPDNNFTALWGLDWGNKSERKACRVLALCFMAAITDWEEKHGR